MFDNLPFVKKTSENESTQNHSFNLLRPARVKLSFTDKFYLWMSGTCRLLIIFVELAVIASLGYRFYIDRNANDLKNEVRKSLEYLEYRKPVEQEVIDHELSIKLFKELSTIAPIKHEIIPLLYSVSAKLSRFDIILTNTELNISGQGERGVIDELENLLKSSPKFKNVVVTSYVGGNNSSSLPTYDFSIHSEIN